MSSPASRPRSQRIALRSRRQRLAAGAVLATTGLLGTYLAAIRPQPTYASPGASERSNERLLSPLSSGLCALADDTTVYDDTSLRTAVAQSDDDSVICIGASFTLSSQVVIDDTAVTIIGRDDSAVALSGGGSSRLFDVRPGGSGKTLTFRDLTLRDGFRNAADGGAVYVRGASSDDTLIFDGVTLLDNRAGDDGGALFVDRLAALVIRNSDFTGNDTGGSGDGGAIFARNLDLLDIHNSDFTDNYATDGEGGAIYTEEVEATVIDTSAFGLNRAYDEGGALSLYTTDSVVIANSTFTSNGIVGSGYDGGGAILIDPDSGITSAEVTRSTFDRNRTNDEGGAIASDTSNSGDVYLAVSSSTFIGNRSDAASGGAIYADSDSPLTVTSSAFINNFAGRRGGALRAFDGADVVSSLFQGNDAVLEGGGVYIAGDRSSLTSISGSTFINNGDESSPSAGGGLFHGNVGELEVTNSTFVGNEATTAGAGIYLRDYSNTRDDTIAFTTVTGNVLTGAGSRGAGVFVSSQYGGNVTTRIYNSIIAGNDDSTGTPSDIFDDSVINGVLRNSLITSITSSNITGSGVATGEPLLASATDNGGPLVGDDSVYYLPTAIPAWNSPAVGIADPTLVPSTTSTQIGTTRVGNVAGSMNASGAPTPPTPTYPPSAPRDVMAEAGDGQAVISWSAPASSGSFAITDYQVVLSPGGQSCLVQVPELSCTVTGLTNGVSYTAEVRALNGAGWGPSSDPSSPFTPKPPTPSQSIVITGSRDTVAGRPGVYANGVTTGLVGTVVRARVHLSGEAEYRDGSMRVVTSEGTFRWQRRTGKKVYVYFVAEDGSVRSNRLVIAKHNPSAS